MTTLPAATVAPRSVTNLPRNSPSLRHRVPLRPPWSVPGRSAPWGWPDGCAAGGIAGSLRSDCNGARQGRAAAMSEDREEDGDAREIPGPEGFVERDGVKVGLRGRSADRADCRRSCFVPDRRDRRTRRPGRRRCPTSPGTTRVITIDPRGNGRSDRPSDPAAYADTEFADGHHRGDGRSSASTGRCSSGCAPGALAGRCWPRPRIPTASPASSRIATLGALPRPSRSPSASRRRLRRGARRLRGLGQGQPALLAAGLARLPGVLLRELLSEPHSTKQIEDCIGWALETGPETMLLHDAGPISASDRARRPRRCSRGSPARC